MKIWLDKFIVKIWQGALNQHMQVSKGESRHACMHCNYCIGKHKLLKYIKCSALMCRVNSYINEKFDYPLPRGLNCTCLWLYDRLATHL